MDPDITRSQLLKKKVTLEDGVARIAHTRKQLRDSSDLVKDEIRNCFGHQLSLLRSREQQLLATLDTVIAVKDEILSEQQDLLHQALGACHQSEECMLIATDDAKKRCPPESVETVLQNVEETLNRLSHVDVQPRETAHVAFEADYTALRRYIQTFGRISSAPQRGSLAAKHTLESLPGMEMDDYEDHTPLFHKAVNQIQRGTASLSLNPSFNLERHSADLREALTGSSHSQSALDPSAARFASMITKNKGPVNQVGHWLHHMKTSVESEPSVFEDFEIVQQRSTPLTVSEKGSPSESLFNDYFAKILSAPTSEWTLPETQSLSFNGSSQWLAYPEITNLKSEVSTEEIPANAKSMNAGRLEDSEGDSVAEAWIETAFRRVLDSDRNEWLAFQNPTSTTIVSDWRCGSPEVLEEQMTAVDYDFYRDDVIPLPKYARSPPLDEAITPLNYSCSPTPYEMEATCPEENYGTEPVNKWLAGGRDRVANEQYGGIDMAVYESILGWKGVLEKVHTSGDEQWLMKTPE